LSDIIGCLRPNRTAIDTAVIEQEPYHQLCHQLTCLFRQHFPQRARLIEACGIRQTEQVELMDWPVIGSLTLTSH
jgi:hypothetical protein